MEYEFTILTMPTNKQIKISFGQICKKKKLAGIIVDGLAMDMPYYEQIKNSEIPCVLVDVALESDHVCEISVDNEKASFEEVEHLIENGCRNIAMLSGKKMAQVVRSPFLWIAASIVPHFRQKTSLTRKISLPEPAGRCIIVV